MNRRSYFVFLFLIICSSLFLAFWELDKVDIEASEDIYLADSVGYLRQDPFIVPRHHLRKPHYPASPHPFLVQSLAYLIFKAFGLSIFTARLLQASSLGFTTMLVIFISYKLFKSPLVAIMSGLIYTTVPLVVRFSRMAIIDPMLTLVLALGMVWSWSLMKSNGKRRNIFVALCGITWGLALSIKLTGIFYGFPFLTLFLLQYFRTRDLYYIKAIFLFLLFAGGIFVLFNDPFSYYYGWTHFSDPKYKNVSLLAIFKGLLALKYWYIFCTSLLGFGIVASLFYIVKKYHIFWKTEKRIFLLIWFLTPVSYLTLNPPHITGLSAEWSYVPVFVPLAVIIGKALIDLVSSLKGISKYSYILLYFIATVPMLILYGLRFRQMPLATYLHARNVVRYDLAVTKTIQKLNQEERKILVLVNLKSVGFPLWLLKDTITTEPQYHPISDYNYVVSDNEELIQKIKQDGFFVVSSEKNPTEREIVLLKNISH